jgi:hypothetical protein
MSDRNRDWADIEAMVEYKSIDVEWAAARIEELDGSDSQSATRLRELASENG